MAECSVHECNRDILAKDFCAKHYKHLYRYGYILEKTRYDKNEYVVDGDIVKVFTTDKRGKKNGFFIVDTDDFELIKIMKWGHGCGYICGSMTGRPLLHRFIMKPSRAQLVDHINFDRMDNRRSNLRVCSRSQNNMNRRKTSGTSSFKGVYWYKDRLCWKAEISLNGLNRCLGYFDSEVDAAVAYDEAASVMFGEFALLNFDDQIRHLIGDRNG